MTSFAFDLIHSEEEVRHALSHLLLSEESDKLKGEETMTLCRNVRKKYDTAGKLTTKEGVRQVCSFRTVEDGLMAAYQAALCPRDERGASALYVNINPRNVVSALKTTHERYFKWLEQKAGASKQEVKGGGREDFAGTLDRVFALQISRHKNRSNFQLIDVDDNDPNTWLRQIREAIGEKAIEMIIETKNGFHVVYRPKRMEKKAHLELARVLQSDKGKGKDASVTKIEGTALACALPGGYQADHKIRLLYCACARKKASFSGAFGVVRNNVGGDDSLQGGIN